MTAGISPSALTAKMIWLVELPGGKREQWSELSFMEVLKRIRLAAGPIVEITKEMYPSREGERAVFGVHAITPVRPRLAGQEGGKRLTYMIVPQRRQVRRFPGVGSDVAQGWRRGVE